MILREDENPDDFDLLESIQQNFEKGVESISEKDKKALKKLMKF